MEEEPRVSGMRCGCSMETAAAPCRGQGPVEGRCGQCRWPRGVRTGSWAMACPGLLQKDVPEAYVGRGWTALSEASLLPRGATCDVGLRERHERRWRSPGLGRGECQEDFCQGGRAGGRRGAEGGGPFLPQDHCWVLGSSADVGHGPPSGERRRGLLPACGPLPRVPRAVPRPFSPRCSVGPFLLFLCSWVPSGEVFPEPLC